MNSVCPVLCFRPVRALRAAGFAAALSVAASGPLWAQAAPKPPVTSVAPEASAKPVISSEAIVLSPFEVVTEKDDGFAATNAGTATKLGLDMKDMAAPYSVMTGEFIAALGITDLQEATLWSTNGSPVVDAQGADQFAAPSMYNIRGATINAGQQRNFFTTAAIGDTYNTERIDFGRGPNAVLFNTGANDVLGGGISMSTKRARVDRNFETVGFTAGSWDKYRSTLDVNRKLTDKLAVRANAVWQDNGGYMQHEFEKREGLTVAGTYRFHRKTELRLEALYDKVARTRPTFPSFDRLSGWDGSTVFSGPITNAQLAALTLNGETQGIERVGTDYVYIPGQGTIMNWTNTARSRRGDSTPNVPLYTGGRVLTRGGNTFALPFGNWAAQGRPSAPAATNQGGDQVPISYAIDLPVDRFDRAIANSKFRAPGKRFTNVPDDPLYTGWDKSYSLGFTHQFNDSLFFEAASTYDRYHEKIFNNVNGFRDSFLDLNRTLPDGSPNPHFLDVYGQGQERIRDRYIDNAGVRGSLNYLLDLGKWGNYTFNLTGAFSKLERDNRQTVASVGLAADPREWQGQTISVRNYWNEPNRTMLPAAGLPTGFFNRVAATDGNSFTTSTGTVAPRWVLNGYGDETETQSQGIFAMAGRYFGGKLVLNGGARLDRWKREVRNAYTNWGFLPNAANWDGFTLNDSYWRPTAPADWKTLTYIPKNADGTPSSKVPILAIDRPMITGTNGVNTPNPLYAGDRFRNDYNAPARQATGLSKSFGGVYHVFSWMTAGANYGDSYKPRTGGEFTLDGQDADPETGKSYDAVVRFSLFRRRLDVSARYYFNRKEKRLGDPPGKSAVNSLLARNDATDGTTNSRNQLGFSDVIGGDYFATKNKGYEFEISGRITRGWRMTGSLGTALATDYDRWNVTQNYIASRKDEFRQVLERAGGRLDTTLKPAGAPSAPGLAVVNTAVTAALPAEQQGAVNDYNTIWQQYDLITTLADTVGVKKLTAKIFTDYTVQEGRFRGVRFGLGANYVDQVVAGYRAGDTLANPNYNAALPISATNLTWIDDPSVDANTPVWIKQPFDVTGTIGYSMKLKSGPRIVRGKEIQFNLIIRNLMNWQKVIAQDEGVALRNPNGDFTSPVRQAVPGRIGLFQRPINFELTTTLKL